MHAYLLRLVMCQEGRILTQILSFLDSGVFYLLVDGY